MRDAPALKPAGARRLPATTELTARQLLLEVPVISPEHTNSDVFRLLGEHPQVIGLPVVEHGRPVGLINRNIFMDGMARPFHRDLFSKKSCIAFMDKEPLVVEQSLSIEALSFQVAGSGRKTLNDGFIITDAAGNYLGVGTSEELVRMVTELQAEKNRLVMESINYASVIQKSFLRSSRDDLDAAFGDYFIHWEPRDKVGGDYYFCRKFDDGVFFALIDCTGHGVPGAFMTLIMAAFIDHILLENNRHDPAAALAAVNQKVKHALGQIDEENVTPIAGAGREQSDDGMDAAFLWLDAEAGRLVYAGAKTPLFVVEPGAIEVNVIEGDRKGVGYVDTPMDYRWSNREIALARGSAVYLTTDGIIDQIGGAKAIAFGKRRFARLLLEHRQLPLAEQQPLLLQAFYDYQGTQQRRDDVSLMGFRF